jgi:hypothetical protein
MLVEQKKITKINLPGPRDADTSQAPAAAAVAAFQCVEVVTWPFVVIAICTSYYTCSLLVKNKTMLVEPKKN